MRSAIEGGHFDGDRNRACLGEAHRELERRRAVVTFVRNRIADIDLNAAAEDDIARAGRGAVGIGARCADDQVAKAVAIDITRCAHRPARIVPRRDAVELEAVAAVEG